MTARAQAKFLLPMLVLLLAGGVYYSLVASKTQRESPVLSEKVWQVEIIEVSQQTLSPTVTLYGRIESPEQLKAAAPGGGNVDRVYVRNGARVNKGDALVTMDRRDFNVALLQARADVRDIDSQIAELEIRHRSNLAALQTAEGQEMNGLEAPPLLTDPAGGDFTPQVGSEIVDRGVVLPGVNDKFEGSAPDIGAVEHGTPIFSDGFESGDLSAWSHSVP